METHERILLNEREEGSTRSREEMIVSRNQWIMGGDCGRPCWATAGRTSVGATFDSNIYKNVNISNSIDDTSASWESRAFAEDAASCSGQWPPRSYTCSFCQREFRTAQALGGHMNVHRRERAQANQWALQQQQQQQQQAVVSPDPTSPAPWCFYSPSPMPVPIPKAAADDYGGTCSHVDTTLLHFLNCKENVMNKFYTGGAFQPYQSRQEEASAAVPSTAVVSLKDDHLDLELRLGPSMICGQ